MSKAEVGAAVIGVVEMKPRTHRAKRFAAAHAGIKFMVAFSG